MTRLLTVEEVAEPRRDEGLGVGAGSEGEDGWLADENLLPLSLVELDQARFELGRGSERFWQVLDVLFARAATRTI